MNCAGMTKQRGEQGPGRATYREWRRTHLLPLRKNTPGKKPRTRRCKDSEDKSGRARRGHRGHGWICDGQTPQGLTGTWAQAEEIKGGGGGAHSHRKRRRTQAHGVGRIEERWRLAGGRCGQRTGGRRFAPGEKVGSMYKQREGYGN